VFVSSIGLGTMNFGLQCSESEATEILDYAYGNGVTLIDTAEIYPVPSKKEYFGVSENILGNWLKTKNRESVIISTKVAGPAHAWYRSPARCGMASLDKVHVRKALEGSLQRLQTDYIDIYQAHWPDHGMRIEDLLEVLDDFVTEGKVRVIGCSNETSWGLMKALWLSDKNNYKRFDCIQNSYSFNNRRFEDELGEICIYEEVSLIAYSALAGGVLTRKYNSKQQEDVNYRFNKYFTTGADREQSIAKKYVNSHTLLSTEQFYEVANTEGVHPATLAVAWTNRNVFVASSLIGASRKEQLIPTLATTQYQISEDAVTELDKISRKVPYPMELGIEY